MRRTHSYFVRVRPTQLYFQTRGWPTLESTAQAFANALAEGDVRPLATTDEGNHELEIRLERESEGKTDAHVRQLNAILVAAQQLGYTVLQSEVREVTSAAVEYALNGALGGGGISGVSTKNPYVTVVGVALGGFFGYIAGESVERIKVIYEVQPDRAGGWLLVPASSSHSLPFSQPA